jgi:hypothetical protein
VVPVVVVVVVVAAGFCFFGPTRTIVGVDR